MRAIAGLLFFAMPLLAESGRLTEHVTARADATQTYTLFLPSSYDASKQHPALLAFDPGGKGTVVAEIFREAAEEYGWIVLSANGARSGDDETNAKAARAMVQELTRYAVAPNRVYAAGFSGTAMLSWHLGITTGLLHGVIGVGGRHVEEMPPSRFSFANYGFAGDEDFNHREMREVDALLDRGGKPHRFEEFRGEHQWITPALARDAFGWFETLAMKDGRRAKDEALLAKLHALDLAAANGLEAAGKKLDALRRYRAIAATFDSAEARAAIARLEKEPTVARELEEEAKWDAFERAYHDEVASNVVAFYSRLRDEGTTAAEARLTRELRIADLQRRAKRAGREGLAARRLLHYVYTQTGFILVPRFLARGEHALAIVTAGVATRVHPDRWPIWYQHAVAHARAGNARAALASLEKAVEKGFRNRTHLATDEDFVSLRESPRFRALLERLP